MTIILILGAVAGATFGLRHFKVWALAPLIIFTASGVVANGIATGLDRRNTIVSLLAAVVCPQIGYLTSFVRSLVTPQQPRPGRKSGFTIGCREQDLRLSNYTNHMHNRAARARHGSTPRSSQGDRAVPVQAAPLSKVS